MLLHMETMDGETVDVTLDGERRTLPYSKSPHGVIVVRGFAFRYATGQKTWRGAVQFSAQGKPLAHVAGFDHRVRKNTTQLVGFFFEEKLT